MDSHNDLVTARSLQMRVEILSLGQKKELEGKLYSQYLDAPYKFSSLVQVTKKMDEIFDAKGFPEAFVSLRNFGGKNRGSKNHSPEGRDDMKTQTTGETGDSKCTFEISVRFRQNATWQGKILWAEKNKTQNFRSVLEMIKLMDEALTDGIEEDQVGWDK